MSILAPVMTLCLSSHIHVHVCNDETALVLLTHKDIGTLYSNTIMYHISFIFGYNIMLIQFLFVGGQLCNFNLLFKPHYRDDHNHVNVVSHVNNLFCRQRDI